MCNKRMNEKCKYCDYVSKCSRFCEYNSIMCLTHRSFPKIVDKTYEELEKENRELKTLLKGTTHCYDEEDDKQLREENEELKNKLKFVDDYVNKQLDRFDKQPSATVIRMMRNIKKILGGKEWDKD